MTVLLLQGSAHAIPLRDESVQCVVTSPPYWGLRAYDGEQAFAWGGDPEHEHEWAAAGSSEGYTGTARWQHSSNGRGEEQPADKRLRDPVSRSVRPEAWSQIAQGAWCDCGAWYGALGLEPTPELYIEHMVEVFREVRRVLRPDGTVWLNLGDSYAAAPKGPNGDAASGLTPSGVRHQRTVPLNTPQRHTGLAAKNLVMMPHRVALALQADGWIVRADIVWHKPNPMPESTRDRPTKSHEYVFLLAKRERYFYDQEAIRESQTGNAHARGNGVHPKSQPHGPGVKANESFEAATAEWHESPDGSRNARSVWTIATRPYAGAHFATFPVDLPEKCVLAGSSPQACGVCGAPWKRLLERAPAVEDVDEYDGKWSEEDAQASGRRMLANARARRAAGDPYHNPFPAPQTVGWQPTCDHDDGSGRCTVLDPFAGTSVTGVAAQHYGRDYVALDLSHDYLATHSRARLAEGLRRTGEPKRVPTPPEQGRLFTGESV